MQRKRFSLEQWRAWFEEFSCNDQTVQQFCADKGTSVNTFYNWRRRLRGETEQASVRSFSAGSFVTVSAAASQVEFELAGGVVARVANDTNSLRPIMEVIQSLESQVDPRTQQARAQS